MVGLGGYMITFIWSCMVLSFKVVLGSFFWIMATIGFSLGIGLIAYFLSGEYKKQNAKKKPKYQGQPIVLKGGKKDE